MNPEELKELVEKARTGQLSDSERLILLKEINGDLEQFLSILGNLS